MAITPSTDLFLLKCPLELDDRNQITFSNEENQHNYFLSLPKLEINDITYQRKNSIITYPANIDSILEYNYCMYKNKNYSDKWFYAYITGMRYVNDGMTEISIKTDVFQTWQFNLTYKPSFVEREHVSDDTIGIHTVPENLETGEYTNHDNKVKFGIGSCHAVVCTTEDPFKQGSNYPYNVVNSIPSGLHYFVVGDFTSVNFIGWLTDWASKKSDLSLINSIFLVPDSMTGYSESAQNYWSYALTEGGFNYAPYHKLPTVIEGAINMGDTTLTKPYNNIDGYIPKNNKLFVYPYNFLMIDNNNGSAYEYRYEEFQSNNIVFRTLGALTPGCSIKTIPLNYKHIEFNQSEDMVAGKLPIGSWSGDVYTNWLTQNAVNIPLSIAGGVVGIGVGAGMIATGVGATAGIGSIAGSAIAIGNTISQIYEHSRIPDQVNGNANSGDVNYANGNQNFTAYYRTIKYEYAKIIDDYFSMYGYKVSTLKVPNITGRRNWNYVKTIGVNIEAFIPQDDLQSIKNLFDNGITLWHTTTDFLDYSKNNSII